MLDFGKEQHTSRANPLVTAPRKPFLRFTLNALEARYESIEAFLTNELELKDTDMQGMRDVYQTQ